MTNSDTLERQINRNIDTITSQLRKVLLIIKNNKKTIDNKELKILKNMLNKFHHKI